MAEIDAPGKPSKYEMDVVRGTMAALGRGEHVENPFYTRDPGTGEQVIVSHDGEDITQVGVDRTASSKLKDW